MLVEPSVWQVGTKRWMVVKMAMVEEFVDGRSLKVYSGIGTK